MVGDGVHVIDFGFVGGKYAALFSQIGDVRMLWLALIHGGNGMLLDRELTDATLLLTRRILKGAIFCRRRGPHPAGSSSCSTFQPCRGRIPRRTCLPSLPVGEQKDMSTAPVGTPCTRVDRHRRRALPPVRHRDRGRRRCRHACGGFQAGRRPIVRRHSKLTPTRSSHRSRAGRHGRRLANVEEDSWELQTFDTIKGRLLPRRPGGGRDPREGGHRRRHRPREHGPAVQCTPEGKIDQRRFGGTPATTASTGCRAATRQTAEVT